LVHMLESRGFRCNSRQQRSRAQDQVKRDTPDLVLSDMIMPEMDGIKMWNGFARRTRKFP